MITIQPPPLHDAQREILNCNHRFVCVSAGRRFGKTHLGAVACLQVALNGHDAMWLSPSHDQSEIAFALLRNLCAQIPGTTISQSNRTITANGGTIWFRSAERADNLRGRGFSYLVMDEVDLIGREVWESVCRPALSDKKGRALFITTPKRVNGWVHELYKRGCAADPEFKSFCFPSSANPLLDPAEIEAARGTMSQIDFDREYLARWVDHHGARIKRDWLQLVDVPPLSTMTCALGIDPAVSERDSADWTAGVVSGRDKDGTIYVIAARRLRASFDGILKFAIEMATDYGVQTVAIESVQSQQYLIQELNRRTLLNVRAIAPRGDKMQRLAPVESRIERGIIRFSKNLPREYFDEICSVPMSRWDDFTDATVYSVGALPVDSGKRNPIIVVRNGSTFDPLAFNSARASSARWSF